jgi:hypothetical protein
MPMGKNNRQRRAAKQRKRTQERAAAGGQRATRGSAGSDDTGHPHDDPIAVALGLADHEITAVVRRILVRNLDRAGIRAQAEALPRRLGRVPSEIADAVLDGLLERVLDAAVQGGWSPGDLGELVRRRAGSEHVEVLASLLRDHARRHAWVGAAWLVELEDLATTAARGPQDRTERLASRLWVAALLAGAPDVPRTTAAPGARAATERPVASEAERRKLATVRALLAKAESTPYDEEAEALSMKAQELISRYALDRLLDDPEADAPSGTRDLGCRRIWLDSPYVLAKAALVHQVADANRCRSAVSEKLGFCSVVGDPRDLEAVELLVTSLLVQASGAMLRHGRQVDRWGQSRTRSFRQSFLLAYAGRIGERLRATNDDLVQADERAASLVPALRRQEELVAEAFAAWVPGTVQKSTPISNGEGWVAGQVAADLALLDVHGKVAARGVS